MDQDQNPQVINPVTPPTPTQPGQNTMAQPGGDIQASPAAQTPDPTDDSVVISPTVAPQPEPASPPQPSPAGPIELDDSEEDNADEGDSKTKEGLKSAFSTILILIAAPLIAILLTTFVFQSYEVDGESMETTLQNNDRLIVWKAPATIAGLMSNDYVPARGEIIVFHKQGVAEAGGAGDKQLIKRVVGLPGERVVVRDNKVTVYNSEHPEGFNPDETGLYTITAPITPGTVDVIVGQGEVFALGDNRTNSLDSRVLGTIRSEEIVGELSFRIFPFNKVKFYK